MAQKTRLQIARKDIFALLDSGPKILRLRQIERMVDENRDGWRLAKNMRIHQFVDFLTQSGRLRVVKFPFPTRTETLYVWGNATLPELTQCIRPNSYLSHYSAMSFHSLTEQTPNTIYVTAERTSRPNAAGELTQVDIDHAFEKSATLTSNQIVVDGRTIVLVSGMATGQEGVETISVTNEDGLGSHQLKVSGVERTLIDAVVRPHYCGGVGEILKAFELAREVVSVNTLCAQLKRLGFLYPYHQAIGFYMERAGYSPRQLDLIRAFPIQFNFYLRKGMEERAFDSTWKVFYPQFF
jgi:hypothetical protein